MANNFVSLHIHLVFAVAKRESRITDAIENKLYSFITGVIQKRKHVLIAINGTADHVHILLRMSPDQSVSDLVRDVKTNSSKLINEENLLKRRFEWQRGYGAFALSATHVSSAKAYVMGQKEHHRIRSFKEEFQRLLGLNDVDYVPEYSFDWIDDE